MDLDRLQFLVSRSGRKRTLHSQHCSNSSDRLWGAEGNIASRLSSWLSSRREAGGWAKTSRGCVEAARVVRSCVPIGAARPAGDGKACGRQVAKLGAGGGHA